MAISGAPLTRWLLEGEAMGQHRFNGRNEGDTRHFSLYSTGCGRAANDGEWRSGAARVREEGGGPEWASWATKTHWARCNRAGFGENENKSDKRVGQKHKSDKRVGQKHGRDEMGYRISFQEFEF
jgi:hypothetical protein